MGWGGVGGPTRGVKSRYITKSYIEDWCTLNNINADCIAKCIYLREGRNDTHVSETGVVEIPSKIVNVSLVIQFYHSIVKSLRLGWGTGDMDIHE